MKTRRIAYWVTTGLTAFIFLSGGAADLAQPAFVMEGMAHLGYPVHFVSILGVWKVLGGIAVLVPRFPRLKEWAYAGMLFERSCVTCRIRRSSEQNRDPAHPVGYCHSLMGPSPREPHAPRCLLEADGRCFHPRCRRRGAHVGAVGIECAVAAVAGIRSIVVVEPSVANLTSPGLARNRSEVAFSRADLFDRRWVADRWGLLTA